MLVLLYILLGVIVALAIIAYATWLFVTRLQRKEPKFRSFRDWIQHVFEGLWGL